jgi:hypothetical protein
MNESRMKDRVNTWTLQVVAASRFLLNLYRVLGDDKQAYRAMMAGKASIERLGRLHLVDQAECTAAIRNPELTEIAREELAWRYLVEGLGGLCTFYAMSDMGSDTPTSELQKPRRDNLKGFRIALQGYRAAFPLELAEQGIREAIDRMVTLSVGTLVGDLFEGEEEDRALKEELRQMVFDALWNETR